MKQLNSTSTFIGNVYPFFLNNSSMKSYYLYQVYSPEVMEDQTPLLSLRKISEKTGKSDFSASEKNWSLNNGDILATIMRSKKKYPERAATYLINDVLSNNNSESSGAAVYSNGYDFPLFELEHTNGLTKAIIVGLRDSLRWNQYRFQPDSYVDILINKDQFGLFKIEGTNESISLSPVGLFDLDDVNLENPIKVDWNKVDYPKNKFSGVRKASDLNKAIRIVECKSFNNNRVN